MPSLIVKLNANNVAIALNVKKYYISFHNHIVLKQVINHFSMYTTTEKLATITHLDFLKTLKELEIYINITSYLQQYCPMFAAAAEPLMRLGTLLLKNAPRKAKSQPKAKALEPNKGKPNDQLEST
ncbi:hypothetical protein TWF481_002953 [Arthrobotrys musiformis]|uniref:Homing endonuclease LAGLIDADG domain-containing protein n=1 Tax=Arthrobotrys musiformis TaxID=47236 RepID=A0AAV9VRX6_9PEZI